MWTGGRGEAEPRWDLEDGRTAEEAEDIVELPGGITGRGPVGAVGEGDMTQGQCLVCVGVLKRVVCIAVLCWLCVMGEGR